MTMATLAKNIYEYKVHPLAELFPALSPDEFKKLKDDIQVHGQQEPIMLSSDGTVLLDGRHRLRACKELGIQPRIERFDRAKLPFAAGDYIWSKNVLRGNKWADTIREAAKQRMKDGGKGLVNPPNPIHTREAVAKKAGVSTHKIRQVETVAKKAPELLPKIESGEMKLKDAVKEITVRPEVVPAPPREMVVSVNIEKPSEPEVNPDPDGPSYTIRATLPQGRNIRRIQAALITSFPDAVFKIEKDEAPSSRADRLSTAVMIAQGEVEELKQELESWKENLPENLQDGQKAQDLETAIEQLDEVISALDDARTAADSVEFPGMF